MTLTGIAMGVAGRTAPLSGTEHLLSHLLDMAAGVAGRPLAFHGAQVGVASVLAATIWSRHARPPGPARPDPRRRVPGTGRRRTAGPRGLRPARPERPDGRRMLARRRTQARRAGTRARAERGGLRRGLGHAPDGACGRSSSTPDVLARALDRRRRPGPHRRPGPARPGAHGPLGPARAARSCATASPWPTCASSPAAGTTRPWTTCWPGPASWECRCDRRRSGPVLRRPTRRFGGYVFDLDGTLYLGDQLLPGAAETVGIHPRRRARGSRSSRTSRWRPPPPTPPS